MKIAITGASGLLGRELIKRLAKHQIHCLVRSKDKDGIFWNPESGEIEAERLEGLDAIIHLAGANIADSRWSPSRKQEILDSRVKGTKLLVKTINQLSTKPKVCIFASAIGIYKQNQKSTETSQTYDDGFLAEVCKAWEKESEDLSDEIRKVILRIGIVLSTEGGALKQMLLPFKLGLGGKIGSGEQYLSWISIRDLVELISYCLDCPEANGIINGTAPQPVNNIEFTNTLAKALKRPAFFPVPAFICKLLFGSEFAEQLLLNGVEVYPEKAIKLGFQFQDPDLKSALKNLL